MSKTMKIGREVEGRFKGLPTLFCSAEPYTDWQKIKKVAEKLGITHIYISDTANILNYADIGDLFPTHYITLDVTKVLDQPRPPNVSLMFRIKVYDSISRLNDGDQVKFEKDRNVIVLPMYSCIRTKPEEFAEDVELPDQDIL